jgi:hypothetical protein
MISGLDSSIVDFLDRKDNCLFFGLCLGMGMWQYMVENSWSDSV